MKILYLTSRFPFPPDRGDRLRAFHVVKSLSREHAVHLLSFIEKEGERASVIEMRRYCEEVDVVHLSPARSRLNALLSLFSPLPLQVSYYSSSSMRKLVEDKLSGASFDLIMVHLFRMAEYVRGRKGTYKIIDFTDVVSRELEIALPHRKGVSRAVYLLETPRIHRYEKEIALEFDETWLVSQRDIESLKEMTGGVARSWLVPNGVDVSAFRPVEGAERRDTVIFVGHMGVFHNQDAVSYYSREIRPLLKAEHPSLDFEVVGRYPADLPSKLPGVKLLGFVEDINGAYNRARVCVAPLRFCTGIQNKVLEPMAAGTPVVATPLANEGIGGRDGRELLLARTPSEFASKISLILRDPLLGRRLGERAREFVTERYSWDIPLRRVGEIELDKKK